MEQFMMSPLKWDYNKTGGRVFFHFYTETGMAYVVFNEMLALSCCFIIWLIAILFLVLSFIIKILN